MKRAQVKNRKRPKSDQSQKKKRNTQDSAKNFQEMNKMSIVEKLDKYLSEAKKLSKGDKI